MYRARIADGLLRTERAACIYNPLYEKVIFLASISRTA
jgi:hypothetical protein